VKQLEPMTEKKINIGRLYRAIYL